MSVEMPFAILAEYERLSLAHQAGVPEQIEAPGLWRGIAFRVGMRQLASGISEVNEIMLPQALTPVPGTQGWLLGVANVRGNLVPVIDLGLFLFGSATLYGERTRILLVRQGNSGNVGLLVDEVAGQRSLSFEAQADAEGEDDPRLMRFVERNVRLDGQRLGIFSMPRLTRAADFQQAAA